MNEKEKMLAGEVYDTRDPEIRALSNRAKNQIRAFNALPAQDTETRIKMLQELFGCCGRNVRVNQPLYVDYGCNISIGDNSLINLDCTLLDTGKITIGHHTLIGPNVRIYTASHPVNSADRYWDCGDGISAVKTMTKPVSIGNYVWIGGGTVILPGVQIGDHVVIGAGSVVTRSIPEHTVACGNPCTVKKENNPFKKTG